MPAHDPISGEEYHFVNGAGNFKFSGNAINSPGNFSGSATHDYEQEGLPVNISISTQNEIENADYEFQLAGLLEVSGSQRIYKTIIQIKEDPNKFSGNPFTLLKNDNEPARIEIYWEYVK